MKVSYILLPIVLLSSLLSSCSCDDKRSDKVHKVHIEDIAPEEKIPVIDLKIVRLEEELLRTKTQSDLVNFDRKYPFYMNNYIGVLPNDPRKVDLLNQMTNMYTSPQMKEFFDVTQKEFKDISDIQKQLAQMFSYIKFYFPEFKIPKVYTTVSSLNDRDLYMDEDVLVINLGLYLGKSVAPKYRLEVGPATPKYIIDRLDRDYLMATICQGYSFQFNKYNDKEDRMLESLIFFGKMQYFTERIMPDMPDTINIMFTAEQLEDVNKNSDIIYAHFVDKKLFYETDRFIIDKYTGERPKVQEIGDKCPGRVGRWLGWQIVRKYMEENPKVTLPELMANMDAEKIFKQSKYKPKK